MERNKVWLCYVGDTMTLDKRQEAKAYDGSRWVCPTCESNNMLDSRYCFHCGVERPFHLHLDKPQGMQRIEQAPVVPAPRKTDLCAVLAVASGTVGLLMLPILFGPAALILAMVSGHRLKDDARLKGLELQRTGMVLGVVSTIWAAIAVNLEAFLPFLRP